MAPTSKPDPRTLDSSYTVQNHSYLALTFDPPKDLAGTVKSFTIPGREVGESSAVVTVDKVPEWVRHTDLYKCHAKEMQTTNHRGESLTRPASLVEIPQV